ncbi:MAG: hypothetical protein F6K17_27135 [Okeania sp. SIO3C4]|nr:hypothetical protein [Okeania sp. SIO3C4]
MRLAISSGERGGRSPFVVYPWVLFWVLFGSYLIFLIEFRIGKFTFIAEERRKREEGRRKSITLSEF